MTLVDEEKEEGFEIKYKELGFSYRVSDVKIRY